MNYCPEHEYVDLGLPSGTLWATCNVGASKPEDYGDYFAWGETKTKCIYDWNTYKHAKGIDKLTKYCNESICGYNGFADTLTELQPIDDPATANWGNGWRTPKKEQWDELMAHTNREWTTMNGVEGWLFTSKRNGNSLFLPAAGYRWLDELYYAGHFGCYWSSSLNTDYPDDAWYFLFYSGSYYGVDSYSRYYGRSVRAVRTAQLDINCCPEHEYVDLGLPSGTLWATCNVGASKPEDNGDYFAWDECKTAAANWGNGWDMPSKEQWEELKENTKSSWTTRNGVNGRLFTASNGNSLFLPAAGNRRFDELNGAGDDGDYWSSSLDWDTPHVAWGFSFGSDGYGMDYYARLAGQPVRAVRSTQLDMNCCPEHEYVDLGLPSGTLWATCNVGASKPEDYGDYFSWDVGETAAANWGNGWDMPSKEQWEELKENTKSSWTTRNGVNGRLFTASNGNSLFLPAVGGRWDDELVDVGDYGSYWSSSLDTDDPGRAWYFYFYSDNYGMYYNARRGCGRSVRPVRSARQN